MQIGWHEALAGAALLFVVFLLVKMRPLRKERRELTDAVKEARARAHAAKDPRARAEALVEAGQLAGDAARWTAATGFFLRAMNTDPAWAGAIEAVTQTLAAKRPRLLEKILWRRLSHVPWDDEHTDAACAAALGLASMYEGKKLPEPNRAAFLRRFVESKRRAPDGDRGVGPLVGPP